MFSGSKWSCIQGFTINSSPSDHGMPDRITIHITCIVPVDSRSFFFFLVWRGGGGWWRVCYERR